MLTKTCTIFAGESSFSFLFLSTSVLLYSAQLSCFNGYLFSDLSNTLKIVVPSPIILLSLLCYFILWIYFSSLLTPEMSPLLISKTQLACYKNVNGVSTGTTLFCINRLLITILMVLRSLFLHCNKAFFIYSIHLILVSSCLPILIPATQSRKRDV